MARIFLSHPSRQTIATRVREGEPAVEVGFLAEGLERLRLGLARAGLGERRFELDLSRPLYPGLRALERTRRAQRLAAWLLAAVATLMVVAGFGFRQVSRLNAQTRSNVLATLATNASSEGYFERAVRFALAGMAGRQGPFVGFDASKAEAELARASHANTLRLRLLGHEFPVGIAIFSPDGSRVLTGSDGDGPARIWNAATGAEIAVLREHETGVWSASFSPDGSRVITGSDDGTARIWDVRLAAGLRDRSLVEAACREVLSVDVGAEPSPADLSRFSPEELQLAPVLDPELDAGACRPLGSWRRFLVLFDLK